MAPRFTQVKNLKTLEAFKTRLDELDVSLPVSSDTSILASGFSLPGPNGKAIAVPNRFCVLPMEGWDAGDNGEPTELVRRRWRRFGESGAGLIWGGEAVAVDPDGRANPHQLTIEGTGVAGLASLREEILAGAETSLNTTPVIGLQLTHSGRFSRPAGEHRPRTAQPHSVLDTRVGAGPSAVMTDDDLDQLVQDYLRGAHLAAEAGFDFVDIKHCHGYLLHELLGAKARGGRYQPSAANPAPFLRSVISLMRREIPELIAGVRLSAYDVVPFRPDPNSIGEPTPHAVGDGIFGGDGSLDGITLDPAANLVATLIEMGVSAICVTAGSPYYNPHLQRPAYFPPSDGYLPPNDPLIDAARMCRAAVELKKREPSMIVVASGISYFQEYLPQVAAGLIEAGVDSAGFGRMALSYPHIAADVLSGNEIDRTHLCRTFSDCTTAPRNQLISGCYPLDEFYKNRPERPVLVQLKREVNAARRAD